MRNPLKSLIMLAILVAGIGLYRGWFTVTRDDADKDGSEVHLNLTVDKEKIREDAAVVKEKTSELAKEIAVDTKHVDESATEPRSIER